MACIVALLSYSSVALVGCENAGVVDEPQVEVNQDPTPSVNADPTVTLNKNPVVHCEPCPEGEFGEKTATLVPDGDLTPLQWTLVGAGGDHYTAINHTIAAADGEHLLAQSFAQVDAVEKLSIEDAPADLGDCSAIKIRLRSRWFRASAFHHIGYTLRTDGDTTVVGTGFIDLEAQLAENVQGNVEADITGLSLTKSQVDDLTIEFRAEMDDGVLLQRLYIYEAEFVLTYRS